MLFHNFEVSFSVDVGVVVIVFLMLLIFGGLYNLLVAYLERYGYLEGYLSLIVAAGVFVTLIGIAILSWQAALIILVCFVASGTPMIIGSITRYIRQREKFQKNLISEARRYE